MSLRNKYEDCVQRVFCEEVYKTRKSRGLTQADMAERLSMAPRSYADIDRGIGSCSGTTLALYIANECPDVAEFVKKLHEEFQKAENEE